MSQHVFKIISRGRLIFQLRKGKENFEQANLFAKLAKDKELDAEVSEL